MCLREGGSLPLRETAVHPQQPGKPTPRPQRESGWCTTTGILWHQQRGAKWLNPEDGSDSSPWHSPVSELPVILRGGATFSLRNRGSQGYTGLRAGGWQNWGSERGTLRPAASVSQQDRPVSGFEAIWAPPQPLPAWHVSILRPAVVGALPSGAGPHWSRPSPALTPVWTVSSLRARRDPSLVSCPRETPGSMPRPVELRRRRQN